LNYKYYTTNFSKIKTRSTSVHVKPILLRKKVTSTKHAKRRKSSKNLRTTTLSLMTDSEHRALEIQVLIPGKAKCVGSPWQYYFQFYTRSIQC